MYRELRRSYQNHRIYPWPRTPKALSVLKKTGISADTYSMFGDYFRSSFTKRPLPQLVKITALFSAPVDVRAWYSASARWSFQIDAGPLKGKTLGLSFRPDLPGPSMALIEDANGYSEKPHIVLVDSESALLRFKHAAIAAESGVTLRVEFELERPMSMPELLPYAVKSFRYEVRSNEKVSSDVLLN